MEYKEIKQINVTFDQFFKLNDITLDNPNYTIYNTQAFFNAADCNGDIKEFIDRVFQDLPINYSITFTNDNHILYVEDVKFEVIVKKKSISFIRNIIGFHRPQRNIYTIQYATTFANQKALINFLNEIHNIKIQEYNESLIKKKINTHDDFEYKWCYTDYNDNKTYVIKYKPIGINIKCRIIQGCIEFVSYLKHEGEIWNNGDEELSISEIQAEIDYHQRLLDNEPIIREKIASL